MRFLTLTPDEILPPLVPMRDAMDEEAMQELTRDVRANGVRVPVSVVKVDGGYRIVAGHRRWLAAQHAGLAEIPAVVKELDDEGEVGEMLAENLHREQPNPLDEARVFAIFQEATGKTIAQIAEHVHKSPQYVANRLRIIHGPEDLIQALRDQTISLSVALALERCTHDDDRKYLLQHAITGGATAATVERWVRDHANLRASMVHAEGAGGQPVIIQHSNVMMTTCEWHRGQTELERSITIRVCGRCFEELQRAREIFFAQAPPEPEPPPPPPPPKPKRWRIFYRAPWTEGEVLDQVILAPECVEAERSLMTLFEAIHPGMTVEITGAHQDG